MKKNLLSRKLIAISNIWILKTKLPRLERREGHRFSLYFMYKAYIKFNPQKVGYF